MTYNDWIHVFAIVVLVCVALVAIIDAGVEFGLKWAIRLKWTLFWYSLRYIGSGCAIALAVDVLRN